MVDYVNYILQCLLVVLYYIARFFGLITFRINFTDRVLECSKVAKFYSKFISIVIIVACTTKLFYLLAELYRQILNDLTNGVWYSLPCLVNLNAILIMAIVLSKSTEIVSVFEKLFAIQNDIHKLTRKSNVFNKTVLILVALKVLVILQITYRVIRHSIDSKAYYSIQPSLFQIATYYAIYLRYFFVQICFVAFMIAIKAQFEQLNLYTRKVYRELDEIGSFRRISMQMCCDCSDEIDKIAAIHWRITKANSELKKIFQGPLITFIMDGMQCVLVFLFQQYMGNNGSKLFDVVLVFIDLISLVLLVQFTKAASDTPIDFLTTFDIQHDNRLQRSVEMFQLQQALQPFELNVLNMFELNNELIPVIVDTIINIFTLVVQFELIKNMPE